MKKVRLKNKVKYTLITTLLLSIIFKGIATSGNNFDDLSSKCDKKMGRLCTYYEIKNFKGEQK